MTARRVTTVTCAEDMNRLKGYKTLEDFVSEVDNQTDLDVELEVEDDLVRVTQDCGSGQMTFVYPFEAQDIVDWTYHWENDNSIRYEVRENVESILDVPVYTDEARDEESTEELKDERTDRVLSFVDVLLFGQRWIDLDGIDLLIMDPEGGPLVLSATFEWITPTVGGIRRPCRPPNRPAVARLYCDGRLALAWPSEAADPPAQEGVERPLRDLVVVDLPIADDPLDLYDEAYQAFWAAAKVQELPG